MIVFLLALGSLCLYGISCPLFPGGKPADGAAYYTDYASPEKTNSVKGIFIIIVLFSHLNRYLQLSDSIFDQSYVHFLYFIGQSVVAPFLFYSGFGVLFSIRKKGRPYVADLFKKRFLRVLLHFDIAILLFVLVNVLLGNGITVKEILLALTGWGSVGNSNWYIFDVLCLYLITYIAFSVCRNKPLYGILLTAALTVGMMLIVRQFKDVWWYDTLPCYAFGMLWCFCSDRIEKWLFEKRSRYPLSFAVLLGLTLVCMVFFKDDAFVTTIRHLLFTATLVLLTMKVCVHNKALCFFGKHLFSIYILQRIPMMVFAFLGVTNPYLFTAAVLVSTIALAVPFDRMLGKLDSLLFFSEKKAIAPSA